MHLSRLFFFTAAVLAPVALLATTWLYLYPIFHACAFPLPPPSLRDSVPIAPFRLLSLGDPQLEGDSSLPNPNAPIFPSLEYVLQDLRYAREFKVRRQILKRAVEGVVVDVRRWLEGRRKAVDLWGNDLYLAHIVRSLRWWTEPSHVAVLGDLLGSQWITDGEFEKRAGRYWGVVMRGLEKVPDYVFGKEEEEEEVRAEDKVDDGSGEAGKREEHTSEHEVEEDVRHYTGLDKKDEDEVHNDAEPDERIETGGVYEGVGSDEKPVVEEVHNDAVVDENAEEVKDSSDAISDEKIEEMIYKDNESGETAENNDDTPTRGELADALAEADQAEEQKDSEQTTEDTANEEPEPETKPLRKPSWGGTTEVLGADENWANRVINIAGNHDVGYAGDLDDYRVARFEKAFGSVNWEIWFTLPPQSNTTSTPDNWSFQSDTNETPPVLRIVVLNSMNIDAPAWNHELQSETYSFMNHIITNSRAVEDKTHATVLLTHIPLEKQPGICVDSPYFNYFDEGQGLREQNMLSPHASKTVLEGIFGMSNNKYAAAHGFGRRGIVVNGHDHEGCDVVHFIRQDGVDYECSADDLKAEEAYWPKTVASSAQSAVESLTGTMEDLGVAETSSPDQMNIFSNDTDDATSPAPIQETPTEPEPEPEPEPTGWMAQRFPNRPYSITHERITNTTHCTRIESSPHLREITLRSMMGDFSGHAGFLSAWFDPSIGEKGEWVFEFASCAVGVQHWWWAVHSIDFSFFVMLVLAGVCRVGESYGSVKTSELDRKKGHDRAVKRDDKKANGTK